jgi:hypothetical protein
LLQVGQRRRGEVTMKIPGRHDQTTTTTDPLTGERLHGTDTVRPATIHDTATLSQTHSAAAAAPAGAITAKELQKEIHDAYERGKRDQRKAQKSHPLLTILIVLLAILGVAVGVLALREGSFSGAGEVLDRGTATAADEAREAAVEAQDAAGEATQDAGAALQSTGQNVERDAEAAQQPR